MTPSRNRHSTPPDRPHRSPLVTIVAVVAVGLSVLLANVARGDPAVEVAADLAAAAPAPVPSPEAAPPEPVAATPTEVPDAAAAGGLFAGRTAGNELTVAVATDGTRAVAYVCDGARVEDWLEGTLVGDRLSLRGDAGSVEAVVDRSAAALLGTVTVGDRALPFAAGDAAPPAGIYQGRADVRGVTARIGWIVLPDGTQVGVADLGGDRRPAPALGPGATAVVDGVPVTVTPFTAGEPR